MKNRTTKIRVILLFGMLSISSLFSSSSGAEQGRILVLSSHDLKQYEEAFGGFKECLAAQGITAGVEAVCLDGEASKAGGPIKKAIRENYSLILALGTVAAKAVQESGVTTPVVVGLILDSDSDDLAGARKFPGVTLDIPIEDQLQLLAKVMPHAKNVGILYDPVKNSQLVASAVKAGKNLGIDVRMQRVEKPSDLPDALESISKRVDVLFGIPDQLVYTPQTASHILLFSLKNRLPFIGLSGTWVKAGALFALECDYKDIGAQCAEVAINLLQGRKPPVEHRGPRKILYSLNLRTAAQMQLDIPESIIQGAREVFR